MTLPSFVAFVGLCLVLSITPGPDTFLVLRLSMIRRKAGIVCGLGSAVGSLAWAALVAVGLAAVLEQSAEVYRVVKILGGLYLVYLGVSTFLKARRERGEAAEGSPPSSARRLRSESGARGAASWFSAGLVSTLLNPKVGLFYLAIVPQFVPGHTGTVGWILLLGATTAVIGSLYLTVVAFVASRATRWLGQARVRRTLENVSSAILAALGVGTLVLATQE